MYEDIFELVTIATRKRNLKESTANAYCHALRPFLNAVNKPWQELTITDADDYLTAKRLAGIMPETYNHYYGALRFMYKRILRLNWDEDEIPRMKRDRSLPTILSRNEINRLLDVTKNLKYKAIFAVMYSGGLRVSEATHLHYDDISRKIIPFISKIPKAEWIDIRFWLTEHLIFLRNTGLSAADLGISCFQVRLLVNIWKSIRLIKY